MLAPAVVVGDRPDLRMTGRFWKMSGSGNDFAFTDGRGNRQVAEQWSDPAFIARLCAAHTGVGADGVAILQESATEDFRLRYFNRDGSLGELCGNASLCATRLAVELGVADAEEMSFETDAGVVRARIRQGLPEIDLQPPTGLDPHVGISRLAGERRLGFVDSGVPHLVVRTDDLAAVDLPARGPELRYHESLRAGANVNWVAQDGAGSWAMRTYERGVEAETLACGTGAVACALLLREWGEADRAGVALKTRSGSELAVRFRESDGGLVPSLRGEGRIVFEGILREV